jgi:protocatechuate 3,4-dioxygenase beta subunit
MRHFKLALIVFAIFSIGLSVQAENIDFCKATKTTMNDYEPEKFEPSNNLLRKSGEKEIFCGQKIVIYGRVLDQNCAPVPDAKIYLWQAGCDGKYPYKPLRNIVEKSLIDASPEYTFTGNGTATTNNNGEFVFITIYPPAMHDLPPHVDVRAEHYILGNLQTTLMLDSKKLNSLNDNTELSSLVKDLEKTEIYNFEIVLPGFGIKNYKNNSD